MFQCGKPDARLEFAVVAGPSAVGPAAADVGLVRLPNFRGLVLGCMDSYDSEERLILQGFSRSTVAPTGEKNVHTLFLRPKKRTFGEGRPSQAGWVQVGPWKAGGGYQRLTSGEPWGNLRVTLG